MFYPTVCGEIREQAAPDESASLTKHPPVPERQTARLLTLSGIIPQNNFTQAVMILSITILSVTQCYFDHTALCFFSHCLMLSI